MRSPGLGPPTETAPHTGGSLGRCRVKVVEGPEKGRSVDLGEVPLEVGSAESAGLRLSDPRVSRRHLELRAGPDAVLMRDVGSRNGTWFEGSRVLELALPIGALVRVGDSWLQLVSAEREVGTAPSPRASFGGLQGESRVMRQVFTWLERAAASESTVLLQGPTGTGKELAARSLHLAGPRAARDFVVVDCSATNPSLLHAALFGHAKGAFTGAREARAGALALSHQGTLFIDEVAGIPLELQPLLLRFLDRGEVQPLGAGETVTIDARVVAATREDLPALVAKGEFRADLYHRLAVVTVELPPLRLRLDDLPVLVGALLVKLGVQTPGAIAGPNLARLQAHPWPGNVRELENVLRRALTLSGPAPFQQLTLTFDAARKGDEPDPTASFQDQKEQVIGQFERTFLAELMTRAEGNIKLASRLSGIERSQLKRMLKKRELL